MSEKSKVVLVYCDNYEDENIYQAMKKGISALGGIEKYVSPKERILVKPNFLVASDPNKAIITHPSVIRGMLRILHENGYDKLMCGDSPGHGTSESAGEKINLNEDLQKYGVETADMSTEVSVEYPEGRTCQHFYYAKAVTEADAIIGLCKMKTHQLEKITGAVKNMFGLVCGYRKAAMHVKYPNASIFARMLADIHKSTPQRLHIMDGVVAMEGNGPGSGDPTPMNVLLFSADPVALDAVFCRLVKVAPDAVPTNAMGEDLGIGTYHFENISIVDASEEPQEITDQELFNKYGNAEFRVDRKGKQLHILSFFSSFMTSIARRPYIDKGLCIKCGICSAHCPVPGKAVDFTNGKNNPPVYNYKKCIRCYCCQEMCPQRAIKVKGL